MLEMAVVSALFSASMFIWVLLLERFAKIVGGSDFLRNRRKAKMKVEREVGEKYAREYITVSLQRTASAFSRGDKKLEADAVKHAIEKAGL